MFFITGVVRKSPLRTVSDCQEKSLPTKGVHGRRRYESQECRVDDRRNYRDGPTVSVNLNTGPTVRFPTEIGKKRLGN